MRSLIAFLFFFGAISGYSQRYAFNTYSLDDGLPQTTIEAITQDSRGYLWVATHGGAARFDGHKFEEFTTSQGLLNNGIYDLVEDRFGNIWFATSDGVSVYSAAEIEPKITHFTNETGFKSKRALSFLERGDKMLIGSDKGIFEFSYRSYTENPFNDSLTLILSTAYQTISDRTIHCMYSDSRDLLWVGTDSGLVVMQNGAKYYTTQNGLTHNYVRCIKEDESHALWVGMEEGMVKFVYSDQDQLLTIEKSMNIGNTNRASRIHDIHFANDGRIYIAYPNLGVFKKSIETDIGIVLDENITPENGIGSSAIQKIFQDRESNLWFGGATNGLSMMVGREFETYTEDFGLYANSVRAIVKDNNDNFWFGTSGFPCVMQSPDKRTSTYEYGENFIKFIGPDQGMMTTSIWSMMKDSKGDVWIGGTKGLFRYDGKKYEEFSKRKGFRGNAFMRQYEDRQGVLWFSTFQGVTCYDPVKDSVYCPFAPNDPLYNTRLSYMYQDENNEYWFGCSKGLVHRATNYSRLYTVDDGLPNNYVPLIIPDKRGNLWLGTGKGISFFNGKTFKNYSTKNGLSSDTPYLMIFDDDGYLWVGTNKGLDRLTINGENEIESIKFYGKEDGFIGVETNSNAAFKDDNGDLWFGTVGGVTRYRKQYDHINPVEPITLITRLRVQFQDHPLTEGMILPYSKNHIMFDFSGVSLTSSKKVRYKYKLKGEDEDWSPELSETFTTYSNLAPGEYTFQVVACNSDGLWNEYPTEFSFVITPPFWRTWWFFILSGISVTLIVTGYVRSRTIRFKKEKELLEAKVNERTKELNEQHEKLEGAYEEIQEKNQDITDSITYAQRIQQGMLPSDEVIKASFNDVFVLYRPKDIVSGDFYWLQKADNRTFFAAVDCTGHGVPGAMVSVLGYNALNRSIREFGKRTPASILDKLNELVEETFSQSEGEVRDGMDAAMCCIYQDEKGGWKLEFAGANNPAWIYKSQQKEIEEIKADKQPIGFYEDRIPFTNNEMDVIPGDVVYLFSDGFADQFGGDKGKKLKSKRFREILVEIAELPLEEQHDRMNQEFDEWKSHYDQVDDVCIIGIRI